MSNPSQDFAHALFCDRFQREVNNPAPDDEPTADSPTDDAIARQCARDLFAPTEETP